MHGRELYGRDISVNRADPKMATEEPDHGYGGSRGARDSYRTETRSDECFVVGAQYGEDRFDDHFNGTRFSDIRDRYGARDRYPAIDDRFEDDRFGGRNAHSGYGRERSHEQYIDVRGGGDRYDQGIHRDMPGPYDHPRKRSRVSGIGQFSKGGKNVMCEDF